MPLLPPHLARLSWMLASKKYLSSSWIQAPHSSPFNDTVLVIRPPVVNVASPGYLTQPTVNDPLQQPLYNGALPSNKAAKFIFYGFCLMVPRGSSIVPSITCCVYHLLLNVQVLLLESDSFSQQEPETDELICSCSTECLPTPPWSFLFCMLAPSWHWGA